MRRITLIVLALMVCSIASAVPVNLTIDWATSHTSRQFYNCAYNPTTGHMVMNGGNMLYIFDGSDGTFLHNVANSAGSFPFSLACTSDGVLYAGDLNDSTNMITWADENTSPGVNMIIDANMLIRGLNVRGDSSSPTLYMAGGGDDDEMRVLQLDATMTTWSVVSTIPAPAGKSYCGVQNASRVLGIQPWGNDGRTDPDLGFPDVFYKANPGSWAYANWTRDDQFVPGDVSWTGSSGGLGGDYAEGAWFVMTYELAHLNALEGVYGAVLDSIDLPAYGGYFWGVDPSLAYYSNATVDAANNKIYFGGRLAGIGTATRSMGYIGRASYTEPKPVINEILYDDPSTDDEEFVEIMGVPGTDISSYTLVGINGNGGNGWTYATIPGGTTIPDDALYVVGMAGVTNVDLVVTTTMQNGAPDAIVLIDYPGGNIIDALAYETGTVLGLQDIGTTSTEGTGFKGGPNFGSTLSLGRTHDMVDTDDNQADFDIMVATPGEKNHQFGLFRGDLPAVDSFPGGGPELAWHSSWMQVRSIDPATVGAPDSPETLTLDGATTLILTASPDSVGQVGDTTGGGQETILGDHEFNQKDINIQGYVYTGAVDDEIGLYVRGIKDSAWRAAGYSNEVCYVIQWCDDASVTEMRAVKLLEGTVTTFASDTTSYGTPGWHHLRIFANGSTVKTYVDSALFSNDTDTDIADGYVGIGYREYGAGTIFGLVDSIIINRNFTDATTAVADWNLF